MSLAAKVVSTLGGACCLLFAFPAGWFLYLNYHMQVLHGPGGHDLSPLRVPTLFIGLLGIPLLLRSKAAYLLFVALSATLGSAIVAGALYSTTQTLWGLVNLPFGAIFLIPAAFLVRDWKTSHRFVPNG